MKIKNGFSLREFCGERLILASGRENIDFSKVINLNESAADMWNAVVGKEFTVDDMVKALLDNYDIDEATARTDAQRILKEWIDLGMVNE